MVFLVHFCRKVLCKPQVRAFISQLFNILPKIHFSLYCFIVKMILSITPSIYTIEWFMVLLVQDYLRHSMRVSAGEQIWGF